jgi:hypothetical protein
VHLSIIIPPNIPLPSLVHEAQELQEAGMYDLWVPDHLTGGTHFRPPWYSCPVALSVIAQKCPTLQVGPLVASAVLRPAATLRSEMEAIASLTPGRVRVALGVGAATDATLTGLPRSPALLAPYAAALSSPLYPLYVASSSLITIEVASRCEGWVYVGPRPENTYGPTAVAAKTALHDTLSHTLNSTGFSGTKIVLIDANEPSPWQSEKALVEALNPWVSRADEVVLWHPRSFNAAPAVSFEQALAVAANISA